MFISFVLTGGKKDRNAMSREDESVSESIHKFFKSQRTKRNRGPPQKLFFSFPNFCFQYSHVRNSQCEWMREIQLNLYPWYTSRLHIQIHRCTERQKDPHTPLVCRACESVVGGDSLALHSCASCWCASLMTNLSYWCFLLLWSS